MNRETGPVRPVLVVRGVSICWFRARVKTCYSTCSFVQSVDNMKNLPVIDLNWSKGSP